MAYQDSHLIAVIFSCIARFLFLFNDDTFYLLIKCCCRGTLFASHFDGTSSSGRDTPLFVKPARYSIFFNTSLFWLIASMVPAFWVTWDQFKDDCFYNDGVRFLFSWGTFLVLLTFEGAKLKRIWISPPPSELIKGVWHVLMAEFLEIVGFTFATASWIALSMTDKPGSDITSAAWNAGVMECVGALGHYSFLLWMPQQGYQAWSFPVIIGFLSKIVRMLGYLFFAMILVILPEVNPYCLPKVCP